MSGANIFLELFTNVDAFLTHMHQMYGFWLYIILGLIFFLESGVFFTGPFLPGDSLLFVAGASCAAGVLDPWVVVIACCIGAGIGNTFGFVCGAWAGEKLFADKSGKWINQDNLNKAQTFFNLHGGNAVALARFIPLIRSLMPLVAGASKMNFTLFNIYSYASALVWCSIMTFLGYWLGHIPFVKNNLSWIVIGSIALVMFGLVSSVIYKKKH